MDRGGDGRWGGGLVKGQLQAEDREGVGIVEGEGVWIVTDAPGAGGGGIRIERKGECFSTFSWFPPPPRSK